MPQGIYPRKDSWAATEDSLIFQIYPVHGAKACSKVLPGRNLQAIRKRANKIGAFKHRDAGTANHRRVGATYRVEPEPISELDLIGLRPWGYAVWDKGPLQSTIDARWAA
jgi:hypothetical protein